MHSSLSNVKCYHGKKKTELRKERKVQSEKVVRRKVKEKRKQNLKENKRTRVKNGKKRKVLGCEESK